MLNHENSQNDKTMRLKWLVGNPKVLSRFLYKYTKVSGKEGGAGLFPSETCEKLVVRGTISFCNNIITILPVGESAVWNVQMW